MGFTTSLQSLTRLSIKVLPSALSASPSLHSSDTQNKTAEPAVFQPSTFEQDDFKLTYSIPVMRANRTRSRSASVRINRKTKASIASAQQPLPLPAEASPGSSPHMLKIVQREPRNHPECLFISGRMADVCAALERMTLNEIQQA